MGTEPFRVSFVLIVVLLYSAFADYCPYHNYHFNDNWKRITLNGLFTSSSYPSIHFALKQVNSLLLSQIKLEFHLHKSEEVIDASPSS